jgi:exodeoxyribonuclease VII large subunit
MLPTEHSYLRLSELAQKIDDLIRHQFASEVIWVVGEISGHKFYGGQSRHYFELIEKTESAHDPIAKFRAVAWSAGSESIRQFEEVTRQKFTNGIQVLTKVKVEYHPVHGLSLVLQEVDQFFTLGNLERQRMDILFRLVHENPDAIVKKDEDYLTRNKSLTLASVLQHLAIVGSPNSEGFVDFMHTLETNEFNYKFNCDIYQSTVQGSFAEAELVQTLVSVYESGRKYDAVVIIRGGGARTDFLVFDTYRLARAVARFPIPVITGIGHHKDVSITDMMAHTSTKTPTKAAEFVISHNRAFENNVLNLQRDLVIRTQKILAAADSEIQSCKLSVVDTSRRLLRGHAEGLNDTRETIKAGFKVLLNEQRMNLQSAGRKISTQPLLLTQKRDGDLQRMIALLRSHCQVSLLRHSEALTQADRIIRVMHPDNVLKKGFAILSRQGQIISDDNEININERLTVTTEHYQMETEVKTKTEKQ